MPQISGHRRKVLELITEHQELSGGDLLKLDDSLPRQSLYVILAGMEKRGWLSSRVQKIPGERNRPRRYYQLTDLGRHTRDYARLDQPTPEVIAQKEGDEEVAEAANRISAEDAKTQAFDAFIQIPPEFLIPETEVEQRSLQLAVIAIRKSLEHPDVIDEFDALVGLEKGQFEALDYSKLGLDEGENSPAISEMANLLKAIDVSNLDLSSGKATVNLGNVAITIQATNGELSDYEDLIRQFFEKLYQRQHLGLQSSTDTIIPLVPPEEKAS